VGKKTPAREGYIYMSEIGCFWCKFRKGLICKNPKKTIAGFPYWDLGRQLERHKRRIVAESLRKYGYGCECSEFMPSRIVKEKVVFT